ncbi:MAG: hypothetical protein HBSAPP02_11430 [Phycisphaerae bacterium]|nr:MAG: hypothetical protein HRU71_09100 [Planctomycetia bacterium]GJQ26111.1 MAG: hypothetical protein HBSAPP02_11430 [Phycisphaerae bacterium]
MILVTVGTQFFDELIDEVDRLAGARAFDQFTGAGAATTLADTSPASAGPAFHGPNRLKARAAECAKATPVSGRLETGGAAVFAQIGLQKKPPKHIAHVAFDRELVSKARRADLIITHAGTGSLMEFLPMGRPLIAVANPTKADNHQLEFLHALDDEYDFCWIAEPRYLESALPQARPPRRRHHPGNAPGPSIGENIAAFLVGRIE